MDPDADVGADVPLDAAVPPLPFVGGGVSSPPIPSGPVAFPLPPVVLRVLPLQQSSAPVGFIYDASPDPVDGGLVAAASAFFSHQGHKVFHDPCPDLEAYCRSMGVPPSTVVNIDRLPDYLLTSGLEILASWAAPSPTGAALAGTAFMAAYLSPSSSGVGTSRPLGPSSSSARPMGGLSSLSASTSAPPQSLSWAGLVFQGLRVAIKFTGVLLFRDLAFRRIHMVRPHPTPVPPLRLSSGARFQRSVPLSAIRMSARPNLFTRILGGFVGGLGLLLLSRLLLPPALLRLGGPILTRMCPCLHPPATARSRLWYLLGGFVLGLRLADITLAALPRHPLAVVGGSLLLFLR